MFTNKLRIASASSPDDAKLYISRKDISGGENNRIYGTNIGENQSCVLHNVDISVPGEATKRLGKKLEKDISNNAGTGAFGFEPRGGTNELLVSEGTSVHGCTNPTDNGSATFTAHKADFTTGLSTTMIKATCSGANGDVVLISNGTDNVYQMLQNHTMQDCLDDNYSCPKTSVITFYRNRVWALKANLLYWSDAVPSTYVSNTSSAPFDRTSKSYNITVGTERALIGVRDTGLIALGQDAVYGINPSATPAATDKPEKILDIGCVAGKTAVMVGDDVLFLSTDGVRGVFRTQQDKLQLGRSEALSYSLKDEFELINWAYITKACAIYFDNKYFIALPTESSTYNNKVWVYYPATQAWSILEGWNVGAWGKCKINGQERLYYIDANDGSVFRAWVGYSDIDNTGTDVAITYQEEGRKEDLGQPFVKKCGGEVLVKTKSSGDYDLSVYAQFDDAGWNLLGLLNMSGNLITFPVTFPVSFLPPSINYRKWHLDSYGEWYTCQLKLENSDINTGDLTVLERSIISLPSEYINEEAS